MDCSESDQIPFYLKRSVQRILEDDYSRSPGDAPACSQAGSAWLLEEGKLVDAKASKEDSEPKWLSEDYSVLPKRKEDILFRLGCPPPQVDAFANGQNHQAPLWFGPGGMLEDSFKASWSSCGLLWIHPPYSKFGLVLLKILKEKPQCIVVAPVWPTQKWFQKLSEIASKWHYYPEGLRMFALDGKEVGPTKWPVKAFLIDWNPKILEKKRQHDSLEVDRVYGMQEITETWQATKAQRRRLRRYKQKWEKERDLGTEDSDEWR